MKSAQKKLSRTAAMAAFAVAAFTLGFTTGSALADDSTDGYEQYKQKQAEKKLPPYKRPPPADPTGAKQHANLAEAATNPLANLVQFELQNRYAFDSHNSSGYANTFVIQPVVPFSLPFKRMPELITRTTLPYVSTPDLSSPVNRRHGFGDLTFLFAGNVPIAKGQLVGVGASFVFPMAGDNDFTGSGKYQAGPLLAYINTTVPKWQLGVFGFQHWSYASGGSSGSGREDVSELSIQPLIVRHFGEGWYVGSPDDPQKYDFKANGFTWNIGARLGKVSKLGKMPVNFFVQPVYNPNAAGGASARWALKANMTLLFPK